MTKEIPMTNNEKSRRTTVVTFKLAHSLVIRASSFVMVPLPSRENAKEP
jgi:hypothetical protein